MLHLTHVGLEKFTGDVKLRRRAATSNQKLHTVLAAGNLIHARLLMRYIHSCFALPAAALRLGFMLLCCCFRPFGLHVICKVVTFAQYCPYFQHL